MLSNITSKERPDYSMYCRDEAELAAQYVYNLANHCTKDDVEELYDVLCEYDISLEELAFHLRGNELGNFGDFSALSDEALRKFNELYYSVPAEKRSIETDRQAYRDRST